MARDSANAFEFPPEWHDDHAMRARFGPLPKSRDVNAEVWDNRIGFWTKLIINSSIALGRPSFTMQELRQRFTRNGEVPWCLETVLMDMEVKGLIQPADELSAHFKTAGTQTRGWSSWLATTLVKSVVGTWNYVVSSPSKTAPLHRRFVVVECVERFAKGLAEDVNQHLLFTSDRLVLFIHLLERASTALKVSISVEDLELVLAYLIKTGRAALITLKDGEKAVKFASTNERRVVVTEADRDILCLKQTIGKLERQMKQLEDDIAKCKQQALKFAREKSRQRALAVLRRKRTLEDLLHKRHQALNQLTEVNEAIQKMETDKEILDAFQAGTSTMKSLMSQYNLSPEKVDDVMTELAEVMADQRAVDDALAAGADGAGVEGIDELERELELLAAEPPSTAAIAASVSAASVGTADNIAVSEAPKMTDEEEELMKQLAALTVSTHEPSAAPKREEAKQAAVV